MRAKQKVLSQMTYQVQTRDPSLLSASELDGCASILEKGSAVNVDSAREELPHAVVVAVLTFEQTIVGLGAIKQARPWYAAKIAQRSGTTVDPGMNELGYVAIDRTHRGQHLSTRIVETLVSNFGESLFATTDSEPMKCALQRNGFVRQGHEWDGKRGCLSLWVRKAD